MPVSLVTGGAGFIGSHVAQELLDMGHEVVVLDDLSGGFEPNIPEQAIFEKGSINDVDLLDEIFTKYKFDYIYHLAAYAAEGLSHFIKRFNYQNNLIGSVSLINEAVKHNVKCFVFTSSIAVYGSQASPMLESYNPKPEDSYGIAKYAVEQELKISKDMFDLDYVIFRPHNVYGERQNISDPYRNVIGIFMNQLLNQKPLTVFGDGTQTRAFSYIADVAPVIACAAARSDMYGGIFNVGSDQFYSLNELANHVMHAMNMKSPIQYLESRNEVLHAYSSHEKIQKFFPKMKNTSLMEGLKQMAKWVKKARHQPSKKFDAIEIRKNLPSIWK